MMAATIIARPETGLDPGHIIPRPFLRASAWRSSIVSAGCKEASFRSSPQGRRPTREHELVGYTAARIVGEAASGEIAVRMSFEQWLSHPSRISQFHAFSPRIARTCWRRPLRACAVRAHNTGLQQSAETPRNPVERLVQQACKFPRGTQLDQRARNPAFELQGSCFVAPDPAGSCDRRTVGALPGQAGQVEPLIRAALEVTRARPP
jgi:hypothetical protein